MSEVNRVGRALRKAVHRADTLEDLWIEEKVKVRNLSAKYSILEGDMPEDDPWTLQGKKFDDNYRSTIKDHLDNLRIISDGTKDY